jgi:hypothetical protein
VIVLPAIVTVVIFPAIKAVEVVEVPLPVEAHPARVAGTAPRVNRTSKQVRKSLISHPVTTPAFIGI